MAERRMFSKPLTSSDLFLEMPKDAQLLYFHLALDADDDGFINSPNKIIRCVGCQKSDMEVLIKKGYLKLFESGIAVSQLLSGVLFLFAVGMLIFKAKQTQAKQTQ